MNMNTLGTNLSFAHQVMKVQKEMYVCASRPVQAHNHYMTTYAPDVAPLSYVWATFCH